MNKHGVDPMAVPTQQAPAAASAWGRRRAPTEGLKMTDRNSDAYHAIASRHGSAAVTLVGRRNPLARRAGWRAKAMAERVAAMQPDRVKAMRAMIAAMAPRRR